MNGDRMEDIARLRIEKLKALKSYHFAMEQERYGNTGDSHDLYLIALQNYMDLMNKIEFRVMDYDIIIEILKKIKIGNESVIYFTFLRKEAQDKADWERLLYLKNKFSSASRK